MPVFLIEWLFVIGSLAALSAVGGFALVPYREKLPFVVLAAPFAGMLLLAFGGALGYNVLGLPIGTAFILTAIAGVVATAFAVKRATQGSALWSSWRSWLYPIAVTIVLAGVVTWYTTFATTTVGNPGFQYWFGTDHLGYAHPADWIIAHPPWDKPRVDPAYWYESWPSAMIEGDPRFGSFALLALTAMVRGLPAAFAYDPACAVVLSATMIGVAALFARGRITLVLLLIGLLSSHWFDYTRSGFFAKSLGYPAGFFVAGLFMHSMAPLRPAMLIPLLLMACGASVVYWAEAPGLFIALLSVAFLAARVLLGGLSSIRQPLGAVRAVWQHVLVLAVMGILALTVRSYVAQAPTGIASYLFITRTTVSLVDANVGPRFTVIPWEHVRLTLADLEHQGYPLTELPGQLIRRMLWVSIAAWVVVGLVALWRRDPVAIALLWGPIALAAFYAQLTSPGAQWTRYQLPGTFYPLALCGAARLLDGAYGLSREYFAVRGVNWRTLAERAATVSVVGLMLGAVALHVPRLQGVIERYASRAMEPARSFSLAETDALAAAIGDRSVRVDIEGPHLSLFLLVELGRRGIDVQWAPSSWKYVMGYRPWPPPEYAERAELTLQSLDSPPPPRVTTLLRTRQYRLTAPEQRRSRP